MADPTANLPQITNFVPRGPVPYGSPGVPVPQVPVVNNFVYRGPNPAQSGYTTGTPPVLPRVIPATPTAVATPAAPAGETAAATAPAPAAPVAPAADPTIPAVVNRPPLPGDGAYPSLPAGSPGGGIPAPGSVQGLPSLPAANFATGGGLMTPGGSGDGIEVIRGGTVTNENGSGVVNGGSGLRDPQAAINAGFATQTDRAQNFINQAMQYVNGGSNIFERATRGRFVNGLLSATVGPNNVGQVQGQGQDTLNSALAGIEQSGIGASANEYGAQLGFAGNEARVAGARALQTQQIESQPVVIGQRFVDNGMGLRVPQPIYGLGTADQTGRVGTFRPIAGNGMVINPQAATAPANPAVGTTRTRASGAVERFDGKTWNAEK